MRCWRPETNRVAGFWYMALREIPGRLIDGILSFITKNHRITPAARLIGQRSVQSGLKQIKEGRQALKNAK